MVWPEVLFFQEVKRRVYVFNLFVKYIANRDLHMQSCRMSRTGKSINCPGNWSDQDENARCIGLTYFQF